MRLSALVVAGITILGTPPLAPAQTPATSEARATRAFDRAKASPLDLHAFLERMPKGADLHMHLSGAVYAETFIADAVADNLCVDPANLSLVKNIGTTRGIPPHPVCPDKSVAAGTALADHTLYDALIDSFSMRSFIPRSGFSGHDQFFSTFDRVNGISKTHLGEWLDEVATRAAAQNIQYLEIMHTPTFDLARKLSSDLGWPPEPDQPNTPGQPPTSPSPHISEADQNLSGTDPTTLAKLRDQLLTRGLRDEAATDRQELADALAQRNAIEHCGEPRALPACAVTLRWIYQVLRAFPPQQVFAQTLLAFEVAGADPTVVALNFVQAEDRREAMAEYTRQMRIIGYLHTLYPTVHITLHAGELAPGLVPPAGLRFHIRQAIDIAHAERIGHGVDVMYETDPQLLLKEMAERHILVEINLTSNDVILGVKTNAHSFPEYRAAQVPVALSTDDEGVSRIDLTHEFVRAAVDFGLSYPDLKRLSRASLEHAFLPGASLWAAPDDFTRLNPACAKDPLGADDPSTPCLTFLRANQHAAQQWELEHRLRLFESTLP